MVNIWPKPNVISYFRMVLFDMPAQYSVENTIKRYYTVWKFQKFSLTEKIFRKINSLVTYLVKPLVSRNFCQKCVTENFRNFHTVSCGTRTLRKLI